MIIFSIIIIHEFGHLISAIYYKWNLEKISIYPFGGCVSFNEKLNKPIKEELIILLTGPLFQIIYFLIIVFLFKNNIVSLKTYNMFKIYNFTLLYFNLLPIYPLDGGRIINCITNYLLPYRNSNALVIMVSIVSLILIVVNAKNINLVLMMVFILTEIMIFIKRQNYLYNRLLLERYLNHFNFKDLKIIKNKNSFYKEKRHLIYIDNKYVTEKEYLRKRYQK